MVTLHLVVKNRQVFNQAGLWTETQLTVVETTVHLGHGLSAILSFMKVLVRCLWQVKRLLSKSKKTSFFISTPNRVLTRLSLYNIYLVNCVCVYMHVHTFSLIRKLEATELAHSKVPDCDFSFCFYPVIQLSFSCVLGSFPGPAYHQALWGE